VHESANNLPVARKSYERAAATLTPTPSTIHRFFPLFTSSLCLAARIFQQPAHRAKVIRARRRHPHSHPHPRQSTASFPLFTSSLCSGARIRKQPARRAKVVRARRRHFEARAEARAGGAVEQSWRAAAAVGQARVGRAGIQRSAQALRIGGDLQIHA